MLEGLPVVGNLLDFRRDHVEVFHRGYQRHGPIFGIRLGPQRGVVLIGPDYHELFFREADHRLSVPDVYRFVIPMFGEVLTAVTDRATRRAQITLLQSAFQGHRLAGYQDLMAAEVEAWLDGLGRSGAFELWDAMERLSMRIAAGTLLGPEVRQRIDELRPLLGDLARGMDFVLPPSLPLPRFRRRDRARAELSEMVRPIIESRRRGEARHEDFLQTLVEAPQTGGGTAGDEQLVGMAMCTLFTGYLTTAAQTSWALLLLLQHPLHLRRVEEEVLGRCTPGAATSDLARQRLPLLERAMTEALRLRPVMSHYARMTAEDYVVGGYRVPRGWLTMLCPDVAHRLPEIFAEPERYDPDRFGPGREEHRRHQHALIGFSGGFYRCPGSAFGLSEIRTVLAQLLARYEVALGTPDPPRAFDFGVMRPASPCLVRYRRRVARPSADRRRPQRREGLARGG